MPIPCDLRSLKAVRQVAYRVVAQKNRPPLEERQKAHLLKGVLLRDTAKQSYNCSTETTS